MEIIKETAEVFADLLERLAAVGETLHKMLVYVPRPWIWNILQPVPGIFIIFITVQFHFWANSSLCIHRSLVHWLSLCWISPSMWHVGYNFPDGTNFSPVSYPR